MSPAPPEDRASCPWRQLRRSPSPRPTPRQTNPLPEALDRWRSIAALSHKVYIRSEPETGGEHRDRLRSASARPVALASEKPVSGSGCEQGAGTRFCPGGTCAWTRARRWNPRIIRCSAPNAGVPATTRAALRSRGANRAKLRATVASPTDAEQRRFEPGLERHLERRTELEPARGEVPVFLRRGMRNLPVALAASRRTAAASGIPSIPTRSTVAWTDAFFADGRSWVLTTELLVVPKDKLVPQVRFESFRGVHLAQGNSPRLPLAFIRGQDRPKHRWVEDGAGPALVPVSLSSAQDGFSEDRAASGRFEPTGASWPRLAGVASS